MKKNKKNEDSTLEPDIPYDGDTNVKKKQSLSDKVTIMKNQVRDFLLDHPKTNFVCSNAWILLLSLISAFIFAYGFLAFTNPLRVPFTSILENPDSSPCRGRKHQTSSSASPARSTVWTATRK